MASDPDKRHTRIFFDTLREARLHLQSGRVMEQADSTSDGTATKQDTAKRLARTRASSPGTVIDPNTGLVRLWLVEAVNSGLRAHEYIMAKEECPWGSYGRIYQLRLSVGDRVTVAERKSPSFDVVAVWIRCST
jgi:hypothetical protein